MFVWKRPKINEKEAGVGPFLKKETTGSLSMSDTMELREHNLVLPEKKDLQCTWIMILFDTGDGILLDAMQR